jgi:hypothetical protein
MTTQLAPDRLDLPPPIDLTLVDADRVAGWIAGDVVGFRGFGDETEATHAAWVARRTLARRLARTHGIRPVPVDIEPLARQHVEGKEMILASGRPIADLIRPGPDSRSGVDSFGFELSIPPPITELQLRAMAYLMYRTLRKSGIRWAMWRLGARPAGETSMAQTSADTATDTTERPARAAGKLLASPTWRASGLTRVARTVLPLTAAVVIAMGVAPFVTIPLIPLAAVLLAGMGAGGLMLLRRRRLR